MSPLRRRSRRSSSRKPGQGREPRPCRLRVRLVRNRGSSRAATPPPLPRRANRSGPLRPPLRLPSSPRQPYPECHRARRRPSRTRRRRFEARGGRVVPAQPPLGESAVVRGDLQRPGPGFRAPRLCPTMASLPRGVLAARPRLRPRERADRGRTRWRSLGAGGSVTGVVGTPAMQPRGACCGREAARAGRPARPDSARSSCGPWVRGDGARPSRHAPEPACTGFSAAGFSMAMCWLMAISAMPMP